MVLLCVKKEENWLKSSWQSTYKMSWDGILNAVHLLFDNYIQQEILIEGNKMNASSKDDIFTLEEQSSIVIRGISTIIKVPIMITFYNQLQRVDVYVQCTTKEFEEADYKKFNISLGQYMDSIELKMFDNKEKLPLSILSKIKSKLCTMLRF